MLLPARGQPSPDPAQPHVSVEPRCSGGLAIRGPVAPVSVPLGRGRTVAGEEGSWQGSHGTHPRPQTIVTPVL